MIFNEKDRFSNVSVSAFVMLTITDVTSRLISTQDKHRMSVVGGEEEG